MEYKYLINPTNADVEALLKRGYKIVSDQTFTNVVPMVDHLSGKVYDNSVVVTHSIILHWGME